MTPTELRQARQSLGLTQAQMALMLGYGAQERVAEIEAGRVRPGASVVKLLRTYLEGYRPPDWPK